MNLMELLQLIDARLRGLAGAEESALQAVFEEVAAGPRPAYLPPDVEPRVILAGKLSEIEVECQDLLKRLNVPFTTHAQARVTKLTISKTPPGPDPAGPNEPDVVD